MKDLQNRVVLITGATDGMGRLTARRIAARGATVLLHGRDRKKGLEVMAQIRDEARSTDVRYYNADLSSLEEVGAMADDITAREKVLHVLINNAGIGGGPRGGKTRELSRDGYELRFAVNYLSHFLLTYRLLPIVTASAPSRIINVSSIGQHPIDFNDVMLEQRYDSYRAYTQSKLAQIMFTVDLAAALKGTGVVVNCLHPATLMNTNMVHEFFGRTMTRVEDGAEALEYVALSEETAGVTGAYFDGTRLSKGGAQAYDPAARRRLRDLSLQLTGASLS